MRKQFKDIDIYAGVWSTSTSQQVFRPTCVVRIQ